MRRTVRRAILLALCAGLIPSAVPAQSLGEQVIGTWTLVSWTRFVGDTEEPLPWGRDAIGEVMFAADHHMCFNVMRRDRARFASPDLLGGTPGEKAAAYETYIGFCGRYELNEEDRSVAIRVDVSSYPNWIGTTQKRFVEVTGNRLQLKTPPITSRGTPVTNTVVWERAK